MELSAYLIVLISCFLASCSCDKFDILTSTETPTPGPTLDSVYQPGTAGAEWTEEEIETTRYRILQAIHPDWDVSKSMYGKWTEWLGKQVTENKIMRLVFHDCAKYTDGSGGCDGCLNWDGVGAQIPGVNNKAEFYTYAPVNTTDNNGLQDTVEALELIYTTIDWPFREASLEASLQQLGKSRADLWQFAGLIALERALERANRACDLDKWARQQVSLLEGRDACEFKLRAPLKFWSGRADCVSSDNDGRGYKASKEEVSPRMFGDARHTTDFLLDQFGMDAEHSQALQAVHGAVHSSDIGTKYTWFGSGYISNMYYKWIANHPTYKFDQGGDLSFTRGKNFRNYAMGDKDGHPRAGTGWRASCMYMWNTTEGGPCFLRPTGSGLSDSPDKEHSPQNCVKTMNPDGSFEFVPYGGCKNAWADDDNIIHDAPYKWDKEDIVGPFSSVDPDDADELQRRHNHGWNNQFAFPWEVSAYWNFTTNTSKGQHAVGCPGLDTPFEEWPFKNKGSPIYATFAMNCSQQEYKGLSDIVDRFASDQQYWSVKFMEAWDIMQRNGYPDGSLTEGPVSGWFGSYSLQKQGRMEEDLEAQMNDGGLVWTDPKADPYICGHRGHFLTSCGFTFSHCIEKNLAGENCEGPGMGPGIM